MILGIDPGMGGALVLLDVTGQILAYRDMPTHAESAARKSRRRVDAVVLGEAINKLDQEYGLVNAFVEKVHSMPRQGVASSFTFGMSYGVVLGVLGALEIPTHEVTPQAWKRTVQLSRQAPKAAARAMCIRIWPQQKELFSKAMYDGRADAALIARHGLLTEPRNPF